MNKNRIFDIKEINDKGDHIIFIKATLDFNIGKKNFEDYLMLKIINKDNDKSIKKDYS